MNEKSGAEMVSYLSKSIRIKTITEPLNSGDIRYYSVRNDGSSSAKTLDEKELYLLKTAATGESKFSLVSLEEPENTNAEGLKVAMENTFEKLELTIDRREHELGLCSDGATWFFSVWSKRTWETITHRYGAQVIVFS